MSRTVCALLLLCLGCVRAVLPPFQPDNSWQLYWKEEFEQNSTLARWHVKDRWIHSHEDVCMLREEVDVKDGN